MATIYWYGTADAVAQIDTVQITGMDGTPSNTTYTLTVGGHTIDTVGDTDANTTATNLAADWNASTDIYFSSVTASATTDTVTLTGDTAGVPFIATSSVAGGSGTIGSVTSSTAVSGPNDWSTAANWSGGAVPVAGDDVILADNAINICWGFAQSAVDLDSLRQMKSYTGNIGLDYRVFATSSDGATTNTTEVEYRDTYLKIESDTLDIGEHYTAGSPAGSSRTMIDLNVHLCVVTIHDTASTASPSGRPAVQLKANSSSTDVFVRKAPGGAGIATGQPGETATVQKVSVSGSSSNTKVHVGDGVTITTFEQTGGTNVLEAAATVTTVTVDGGTLTMEGDYIVTTGNINDGTVNDNHEKAGGNAWTTLNLNGGKIDASGSSAARTWATVNANKGATIVADSNVTITTLNEESTEPYTLTVT